MKVCIVGGTGNISMSITRLLLDMGHQVTCFNRGISRAAPEAAQQITGDRDDAQAFEQAMQRERFDAAIDMICYTADHARSSVRAFRDVGHFVMCSTVATYDLGFQALPIAEDHPLTTNGPYGEYGINKVAADGVLLEACRNDGFPVTILKPSATYGPIIGLMRQVTADSTWIDRIRKGKPIIMSGDGTTIQQFLHVDDAAIGFAHLLGRSKCIGEIYNIVPTGCTTWADYHRLVMKVIGRDVELVGVPAEDLKALDPERFRYCTWFNMFFCNQKLLRDVPEFQPRLTLAQGIAHVVDAMDREGRIEDSDQHTWEDQIIAAQRKVRTIAIA